jgi:3-isopropylmalate/(R)-2-methylmalate dehydratase small subunit
LIECDTGWIAEGDEIVVDLDKGEIANASTGRSAATSAIPRTMQVLLEDGGLIPHLKKHGGFALE